MSSREVPALRADHAVLLAAQSRPWPRAGSPAGDEPAPLGARPRQHRTGQAAGYDWVSPQWPLTPEYIAGRTRPGRGWCPTRSTAPRNQAAAARAVDELITNDPPMARRARPRWTAGRRRCRPRPASACRRGPAGRTLPTIEAYGSRPQASGCSPSSSKQEARHVETYASFRTKIECMIRERVLPRLVRGGPNVVAFNEDVGIMTLGHRQPRRRGPDVRLRPTSICPGAGLPLRHGGAAQLAARHLLRAGRRLPARFPDPSLRHAVFTGGTDTFGRGWMQVFSDMASATASTSSAPTTRPVPGVDQSLGDRHVPRPRPAPPRSVYVANGPEVYNEAFLWAPGDRRASRARSRCATWCAEQEGPAHRLRERAPVQTAPRTGADAVENLRPFRLPGRTRVSASPPACRRSSTATRPPAATPAPTPPSTTCAVWTAWAPTW